MKNDTDKGSAIERAIDLIFNVEDKVKSCLSKITGLSAQPLP